MRLYCTLEKVVERSDKGFDDEVLAIMRERGRNLMKKTGEDDMDAGEESIGGDSTGKTYPVPFPVHRDRGGRPLKEVPPAARAVIFFKVFKVHTSCGYAVPQIRPELYNPSIDGNAAGGARDPLLPAGAAEDLGLKPTELSCFLHRPTLERSGEKLEQRGEVLSYLMNNNSVSLDGLPGLKHARVGRGESIWLGDLKWRVERFLKGQRMGLVLGFLLAVGFFLSAWMLGVVKLDWLEMEEQSVIREIMNGSKTWFHHGESQTQEGLIGL